MKFKTKISIIVPIYKVEHELDRCVKSLLGQTYNNIEIILVDDGSPDSCPKMCDEFAKLDNRVKVIHKRNGGLSDARNAGLKIALGEYVLYVDSDDYIDFDSCERLMKAKNNENIDIIVGNAIMEKNDGNELINHSATPEGITYTSKEFVERAIKANQWYAPACFNMYRKEFLLENNLYFEKGIYFEYVQMLPRVFLAANTIRCMNGIFYHYIVRDNSIMTSGKKDFARIRDSIHIYEQWFCLFKEVDDAELQRHLYGVLIKYYISNCKVRGIKGFVIDGLKFSFCFRNALNIKEKFKVLFFGTLPKVYCALFDLYSNIKSLRNRYRRGSGSK